MFAWYLQADVDVRVVPAGRCRCSRGVGRQMLMFAWRLQVDVDVRMVSTGGC